MNSVSNYNFGTAELKPSCKGSSIYYVRKFSKSLVCISVVKKCWFSRKILRTNQMDDP